MCPVFRGQVNLFGEAKQFHGLSRFRWRGLAKVNIEALLVAGGQNLKRLLAWLGWGKRQIARAMALSLPLSNFLCCFLVLTATAAIHRLPIYARALAEATLLAA